MNNSKLSISSQELGRGPESVESFDTLRDAQQYIRDRWQGPDYIDGANGFHTDYTSFVLSGFSLLDVGKISTDAEFSYRCFEWRDLEVI